MSAFLKTLSLRTEFLIVTFGAFGYFIFASLAALSTPSNNLTISDGELYRLLAIEAALFLIVWLFLRIRGWTFSKIGLRFEFSDPIYGLLLAVLCFLAYLFLISLAHTVGLSLGSDPLAVSSNVTLKSVIAVSIFNPIFEEVFVCGYIIRAMTKRYDAWTGIHLSVAVRLLYHLYQGASAAGLIPIGLVFGYWFARTGRLWPVAIAHGLLDFIGFLALLGR